MATDPLAATPSARNPLIRRGLTALCAVTLLVSAPAEPAQPASTTAEAQHPAAVRVATPTPESREEWNRRVEVLVKAGRLVLQESRRGPDQRLDEWFVQRHQGVNVAGGEVWRRREGGHAVAIEGTLYEDIAVDTRPRLTGEQAYEAFQRLAAGGLGPSLQPDLVVLPTPDGAYALAYRARLFAGGRVTLVYLDAATGEPLLQVAEPGPPPPTPAPKPRARASWREGPSGRQGQTPHSGRTRTGATDRPTRHLTSR